MSVVCAWCGCTLGEKPGVGTTHGICDSCKHELMSSVGETIQCMHGKGPDEWCTPCEAEV